MMNKIIKFGFLMMTIFLLSSCQSYSDGRMLKKYLSRFNHKEYASASTYIFPAERMEFALFVNQVMPLAPDALVELEDYDTEGHGENRKIVAQLKWTNATPPLKSYFQNIGLPIGADNIQTVQIPLRKTNDGESMSFLWLNPKLAEEKLSKASIEKKDSKPVKSITIYSEPSSSAKKIGTFDESVIVGEESDQGWFKIYKVDKEGNISNSYFKNDAVISTDSSAFFHLGLLDSLGLIVAIIVIVIVIAIVFLLCGPLSSILNGIPWAGPIILICLVLGGLYIIYQMLEKILFEMFIINLPY